MPSTRTPGITVDAHGHRTINKEYRGERIFLRLGPVAQENAEHRLLIELDHLELIDYGLRRYHPYRGSSTILDVETLEVVRVGACYEDIASILRRHFGVTLPPRSQS